MYIARGPLAAARTSIRLMSKSAAPAVPQAPLPFVDDYLPALLAQASHLISGEFHRVVNDHGFNVSEWRVLASLAGGDPASIGRLAAVTVMKQPTVTRVLDRMEASGHVERIANPGDRRFTLVRITPAGSRLVARLIRLARAHERRVLEPFGLARAAGLKATLKQMIALHRNLAVEPDELLAAAAPAFGTSPASLATRARATSPAPASATTPAVAARRPRVATRVAQRGRSSRKSSTARANRSGN
jgi:DNA-binding MarR family transcriptional regulator